MISYMLYTQYRIKNDHDSTVLLRCICPRESLSKSLRKPRPRAQAPEALDTCPAPRNQGHETHYFKSLLSSGVWTDKGRTSTMRHGFRAIMNLCWLLAVNPMPERAQSQQGFCTPSSVKIHVAQASTVSCPPGIDNQS